jgi:hypothetical protein
MGFAINIIDDEGHAGAGPEGRTRGILASSPPHPATLPLDRFAFKGATE